MHHKIIIGDCIEVVKTLPNNSIDSVVTDPPYELGFMGKHWDSTGIAYNLDMWKEVYRLLKPGGHLLSFGGTRTYHRMASAVEDAGFEIRDMILWIHGQGFPKSLDVSKAIDKMMEYAERRGYLDTPTGGLHGGSGFTVGRFTGRQLKPEPYSPEAKTWNGWGTALKPACEPIVMARKPLGEKTVAENVLKYGTGAIDVDGGRIGVEIIPAQERGNAINVSFQSGGFTQEHQGRFPSNVIIDEVAAEMLDGQSGVSVTRPHDGDGKLLDTRQVGWGFKRLPCDISDSGGASRFFYVAKASAKERWFVCKVCGDAYNDRSKHEKHSMHCDDCGVDFQPSFTLGTALCVAETGDTRIPKNPTIHDDHNTHSNLIGHPTQKPLKLIEYLVKLVTPPDGTVLDPFLGSGTLTVAARNLGFNSIGIEQDDTWIPVYRRRLRLNEQLPTGDVTYEIVRFQE